MIRKEGSKFVVRSEDGATKLGEYETREEAEKRLKQVEYWKNVGKKFAEHP